MQTARIIIKVDSEDVHIPELKKFMGKTVEIIITEVKPNDKKMENFFGAVGKIKIDEKAIRKCREISKL